MLRMLAYNNIEQAIEIANDSVYGLSSDVYAKAKDKVSALKIARWLQAGQYYI